MATRMRSAPAFCKSSTWRSVAAMSCVRVAHMLWTAMGLPAPILRPRTVTVWVLWDIWLFYHGVDERLQLIPGGRQRPAFGEKPARFPAERLAGREARHGRVDFHLAMGPLVR